MAQLHLLSPLGFRAAGVYAGIRTRKANDDLGCLVCDTVASVMRLCLLPTRCLLRRSKLAASGFGLGSCAALSSTPGTPMLALANKARRMQLHESALGGDVFGCDASLVLPSSTGIIGHLLPMAKVDRGILEAGKKLGSSQEHAVAFGSAIMTTDLVRARRRRREDWWEDCHHRRRLQRVGDDRASDGARRCRRVARDDAGLSDDGCESFGGCFAVFDFFCCGCFVQRSDRRRSHEHERHRGDLGFWVFREALGFFSRLT